MAHNIVNEQNVTRGLTVHSSDTVHASS